jgi:uncharacterized protein (TIGR02996 family)
MLPSLGVVAVLMAVQSAMTPKSFAPSIIPPWDYRLTQPFVWLRYAAELFAPIHLNVDTDLSPFSEVNGRMVLGLAFLAALSVAIWVTARRRRLYPIAYGLIWFVVTQLPTSLYPLSEVENDHRMFFSFAGLIVAVVWAAWLLLERLMSVSERQKMRPVMVACVVLVLNGYAWGVHERNRVWHDEDSLWLDDVQKSPENGRGLMNYGLTLMAKGEYTQALDYFERALQFTPNYATLEIDLGIVNGQMGRPAEAERHFLRAIELAPNDDTTHAYYGRWLNEQGRVDDAIAQLQTAIALNPLRPMQHETLLQAYAEQGDAAQLRKAAEETLADIPGDAVAEAMLQHPPQGNAAFWVNLSLQQYRAGSYDDSIASARRALALQPQSAEAYNNIGADYGALGQWDEAIENEREALRINPGLQIAKNNLAAYEQKKLLPAAAPAAGAAVEELINRSLAMNQAGRYEDSIAAAQAALRVDPNSAEAWNNIAAGDEALHRWDAAIAAAQKALALRPDFQLAKNNLAWSQSQKQIEAAQLR